uniref:Uncharacterized protein n=1 Tax=Kalanchoe fedtschenkoi TaxID=63787 RepID=A0A7N1A098_KALFE
MFLQMMKAASGAWLILFVTFISTWMLSSYALAPTDLSLPKLTAHIRSTDGGGEKVIHKSMGAQGGRGAGGGGSLSDRPEAVRKSSGSKLLVANNLFTSVMAAPLAVHLFG